MNSPRHTHTVRREGERERKKKGIRRRRERRRRRRRARAWEGTENSTTLYLASCSFQLKILKYITLFLNYII